MTCLVDLLWNSLIMNLPECAPGLTTVIGALPIPAELILLDVIPDHALFALFAADNCIAGEYHSILCELAGEIEIGAGVIHPGLAPQLPLGVIRRDADSMQVGRVEIFMDNFPIQDSFHVICSFTIFTPCCIPFAKPKV